LPILLRETKLMTLADAASVGGYSPTPQTGDVLPYMDSKIMFEWDSYDEYEIAKEDFINAVGSV
ncbi:hypothetical protein CHS0354_016294, partial [Potamilus streckersoni]